jgi:hypothetical protein
MRAIVIINVRVRNALLLDSSFALKQLPAFIPHFRQTLFIFYFIFQTFTAFLNVVNDDGFSYNGGDGTFSLSQLLRRNRFMDLLLCHVQHVPSSLEQ